MKFSDLNIGQVFVLKSKPKNLFFIADVRNIVEDTLGTNQKVRLVKRAGNLIFLGYEADDIRWVVEDQDIEIKLDTVPATKLKAGDAFIFDVASLDGLGLQIFHSGEKRPITWFSNAVRLVVYVDYYTMIVNCQGTISTIIGDIQQIKVTKC